MIDGGERDEKIIAIPYDDPNYNTYKDISELPAHLFEEMSHFFTVYKALEHKETAITSINGAEDAIRTIKECMDNYVEKYCM